MGKNTKLWAALALCLICSSLYADGVKVPTKIGQGKIYHKGWTDLNKNGVKDVYEDSEAAIEDRIEDLLSKMTVEEKTCQMVTLYGYKRVLEDELPTPEWKEKLWKDGLGTIDEQLNGFIQWGAPVSDSPYIWPASLHAWALNRVQQFFIEDTRLGIPVDFGNEGIRGVEAYKSTLFPTPVALGSTWDRDLVYHVGYITGNEARLLGYTNVNSPIMDVGRDQRWGRYEEIYGESPYLVAEMAVQQCLGLQTDHQVTSTGKHFIAYSNNKGAREGMSRTDPQMSPHEVENVHVYPWREVISRAGMMGVMTSYNDYDGVPIESSDYWLIRRLRDDFGFKGYTISDSDAVEYLHSKHYTSPDMKESVRQSVLGGLNVRCTFRSPESYVMPLRELIENGEIPMNVIDDRVRDILRAKFTAGLFDRPYQLDYEKADAVVGGKDNAEWSLKASRECLVLLKNDGLLPLDKNEIKRIAVVGPNADEESFGHTHYGPLATDVITVLEGIRTALDGTAEVVYSKGCELVDANWPESEILPEEPNAAEQAMIDECLASVRTSNVIIAVLGGGGRTCGENRSRSSINLPGHQELLLKALVATGKPVVLVLINGRPLSINWADRHVNSILEAWYPGAYGGTAIAEALFGDYNPGGKISVTFPKTVGQIPFNFPYKPASQVDGHSKTGPNGGQSRIHGALYDFGYGLSYTTFEYSDLELSSSTISEGDTVKVSFKITNTGDYAGDEIPQLYIHDCISSITVYELQLRGFERIHLEPGETRTVTMPLTPKDLSLLDASFRRVVEPGDFEILVGASSTDIKLRAGLNAPELIYLGSVSGPGSAYDYGYPVKYQISKAASEAGPSMLKKGQYYSIRGKKDMTGLTVDWGKGTDCRFSIQYTNGGGQFLDLYSGTMNGSGKEQYRFEKTDASEVRIMITDGTAILNTILP